MKYLPLIFSTLGTVCGITLAIICYLTNYSSEATAWAMSALWATNCLIYDLRDFKNQK
jgi:hypothetical protein